MSGSQTIYYAKNIVASGANANKVTVTFSAAVPFADVRISEFSGLNQTNPVDVTASASGTGLTASSGTATTTSPFEMIYGAGYTVGEFASGGAGFTVRAITAPDADIVEDRNVMTTGTYDASATQVSPNAWLMQMVTFRAG